VAGFYSSFLVYFGCKYGFLAAVIESSAFFIGLFIYVPPIFFGMIMFLVLL
jgi:hypothetical protein